MDPSDVGTIEIGDGLYLRPFTEADAEIVLDSVRENYAHLRTFMEWCKPEYDISDARDFVTKTVAAAAANEGLNFGIFRGDDFIGTIGFAAFDHLAKVTEMGYWIDQNEEGKGITSRACKALLDLAFGELGMNRVQIRCASGNLRSAAIPVKYGFVKEGVQRQHVMRDGKIYDFLIFGLLAPEWNSRPPV